MAASSKVSFGAILTEGDIFQPFPKSLAEYSPGPVMTRQAMSTMKTLMGHAAEPQEIVDLIMYLSSDKAAFITGITVLADGGRSVMKNKG